MGFFIGFLSVILSLTCLFLMLLILIQLPKKEAGVGTAFGGQATDALFGAGTGNALTRITKYATGVFFVLAVVLAILYASQSRARKNPVKDALRTQAAAPALPKTSAPAPVTTSNAAAVAPAAPLASQTTTSAAPAAPLSTPSAPASVPLVVTNPAGAK